MREERELFGRYSKGKAFLTSVVSVIIRTPYVTYREVASVSETIFHIPFIAMVRI